MEGVWGEVPRVFINRLRTEHLLESGYGFLAAYELDTTHHHLVL